MAVYPRWRGEHRHFRPNFQKHFGLSPLARGTQTGLELRVRPDRFIPAGAGNTHKPGAGRAGRPVYPRWRGEHYVTHPPVFGNYGLSPLARGTPAASARANPLTRFIPAGAGNTVAFIARQMGHAVYPRWRGEHMHSAAVRQGFNGLSPLARGTLPSSRAECSPARFIPAGAGNTYKEYAGSALANGLSPLARGTRQQARRPISNYRFIPAGAGNTPIACETPCAAAVYPRWRGEHRIPSDDDFLFAGLSPLARGTQDWAAVTVARIRFIPAGAGNTVELIRFRDNCSVYPRWRGEHCMRTKQGALLIGLSPLARGTLMVSDLMLC